MTRIQHPKVVVLISGTGSNLQAIIDASQSDLPIEIAAVISNRPDAFGLQRATAAAIETAVLDHRSFGERSHYDQALIELIDKYQPNLVVLAGFMRILTAPFVRHYAGRLLNVHPSLLPKYTGLQTHKRVLEAGDKLHGVSVHFVTEELDGGPVIAQAQVAVQAEDNPQSLAARVLEKEHQLYPLIVGWIAQKRLQLNESGEVILDNEKLLHPVVFTPQDSIK
jgi:phosphoribosylglycinamide formyltransferase-1